MVDERTMQFRLGVMTIASVAVAITLALLFGRSPEIFKSSYRVYVKFEDASGISRGTPVHKFGILVGRVADVGFADDGRSALATLDINSDVRLRSSETFCIEKGLLGDAKIEVVKKTSRATGLNGRGEPAAVARPEKS